MKYFILFLLKRCALDYKPLYKQNLCLSELSSTLNPISLLILFSLHHAEHTASSHAQPLGVHRRLSPWGSDCVGAKRYILSLCLQWRKEVSETLRKTLTNSTASSPTTKLKLTPFPGFFFFFPMLSFCLVAKKICVFPSNFRERKEGYIKFKSFNYVL